MCRFSAVIKGHDRETSVNVVLDTLCNVVCSGSPSIVKQNLQPQQIHVDVPDLTKDTQSWHEGADMVDDFVSGSRGI